MLALWVSLRINDVAKADRYGNINATAMKLSLFDGERECEQSEVDLWEISNIFGSNGNFVRGNETV